MQWRRGQFYPATYRQWKRKLYHNVQLRITKFLSYFQSRTAEAQGDEVERGGVVARGFLNWSQLEPSLRNDRVERMFKQCFSKERPLGQVDEPSPERGRHKKRSKFYKAGKRKRNMQNKKAAKRKAAKQARRDAGEEVSDSEPEEQAPATTQQGTGSEASASTREASVTPAQFLTGSNVYEGSSHATDYYLYVSDVLRQGKELLEMAQRRPSTIPANFTADAEKGKRRVRAEDVLLLCQFCGSPNIPLAVVC